MQNEVIIGCLTLGDQSSLVTAVAQLDRLQLLHTMQISIRPKCIYSQTSLIRTHPFRSGEFADKVREMDNCLTLYVWAGG